ncbi:HesA/MoeB/ThiF family protein [Candidatus Cryosericum septentrionale]|jgi:molybdopterin/thiamine biosynthesis adenylyltransferase|nr:HesA/MoeB/ThiF family protein [Candidatus Cryosericum septentrionale]
MLNLAKGQPVDILIRKLCKSLVTPDKKKMRVIDLQSVRLISSKKKVTRREAETFCLENNVVPIRYLRNIGTIGIEGQLKLLRSTVAVCGAGGLGGTIIELLARQGIGHLVIIDNDKFAENNLNRQIIATESDLRKSKVKIAAARVKKINSAVVISAVNKTINSKNIKEIIMDASVVLDGLDNLKTRRIVARACDELEIPFVHGAIAGFSGELMTIFPGDKGLNDIWGLSADENGCGIETYTGNPAATAAVIAAWEVQEAIKIITGIGTPVRNRLIFLDFAEGTFDEISLL